VENELNKIGVPTILIWGKKDEIIPVEAGRKMQKLIKGSELVEFERCGHLPQEEMPQRVVAEMERFLKSHGGGPK
jgi:pimeloyl-ACP methyl ester carboxylesterase